MLFDWSATIDLAFRLYPDTERIVYIGGASPVDREYEAAARQAFTKFLERLQFEYLTGLPMSQILDRVRTFAEPTVVASCSGGTARTGPRARAPASPCTSAVC